MPAVRRLIRIAFNALTVLSLVLALFVAGLWVRSYPGVESFQCFGVTGRAPEQSRWSLRLASCRGFIRLGAGHLAHRDSPLAAEMATGWKTAHTVDAVGEVFSLPGNELDLKIVTLQYVLRKSGKTFGGWSTMSDFVAVKAPHWTVVVMFSMLPALWASRWQAARQRRRAQGNLTCPTCGYDLRATPDRCPECGSAQTSGGAVA